MNNTEPSNQPQTNVSFNQNPIISYKRFNFDTELIHTSIHLNTCKHILNSCSNSFLFIYNILLESSLDEAITEQIIKSMKTLIYLSALLNENIQREAFVTSLCKAALPANYAHHVLNLKLITDLNNTVLLNQQPVYYKNPASSNKTHSYDDSSERQIQVVAIGPALHIAGANTTSQTSTNSPLTGGGFSSSSNSANTLYITSKNLITMKSILNMAHMYSELIGSSWYIILNTMQHLTWTLGLKPVQGAIGQLKHSTGTLITSPTSVSSSVIVSNLSSASSSQVQTAIEAVGVSNTPQAASMITTAIQAEIAFICNMLSKLFESTRLCSDEALQDIIDALMQLSIECSDFAYLRNDPCLFAVSKLYETCVSNLNRVDLFWQKLTMHLLCACKHNNLKYREWCVDSVCNMIRATFNFKYSTNNLGNGSNNKISLENRNSILKPLHELSSINYNDVRQKQIECTLSILRLLGQHLNESWPLCLNIIGAIQQEHTEALIRSAFQCLQLVVTDFLSMIKANYLSLVSLISSI